MSDKKKHQKPKSKTHKTPKEGNKKSMRQIQSQCLNEKKSFNISILQ